MTPSIKGKLVMKKKTKVIAIGCVVLASAAGPVAAQREWTLARFSDAGTRRYFTHGQSLSSAMWLWKIGSAETEGNLALPAGRSGSACLVAENTLLVSGWSQAQGWLAEINFTASGSVVSPTLATISNNIDVVQLSHLPSAGLLVGIDYNSNSLVAATYAPGLLLGPWEVIVTSSQCPLLLHDGLFISSTPLVNGVGVRLRSREPYSDTSSWVVSRDQFGIWAAVDEAAGSPPVVLPPTWFVSHYPVLTINTTEYQLWVGGGSGDFVVVSLETGAPVYQGHHSGNPSGEVFTLPASVLEYGKAYRIESLPGGAFARSIPFRAESVWPRASVDPNMLPTRVGVRWDFPTVGTDFVSWEMYWTSGSPQPADPVLLTMVVGAWDFGVNPTVPALGVEILAVPFGDLGAQVAYWHNSGRVSFGWTFAVNNPSFVGLKVAMQAVGVLATGQFIVSDVAGVKLVQ
jgi:hypothetical protein